jgi:pimeloyl-ACP methyl ester carboxylesterase
MGATLAALALSLPATAAAGEYEVPWTADFSGQAAAPNGAPAGANDWSCKPDRAHPDPVILVHGLMANRTVNFPTLSPFLANQGFCVFALTYGTRPEIDPPGYQPGGLVRMQDSAHKLKRFAARVLKRTGAERVDIVGHSEGSLMPNYWVKFLGGAKRVDQYVGITPLWDGTNLAGLGSIDSLGQAMGISPAAYAALEPLCASCRQFLSDSDFMRKMNSGGGPRVPGVDYTMIMTRNDELVIPYTSGIMEGADNVVVQDVCDLDQSEHLSIAFDPITAYTILNELDPTDPAREVPCVPVLPGVGAVGYSE